jgi:hypothetical protein
MTMSTNVDLLYYQPDILDYGIEDYTTEHDRAREDVLRRLRTEWYQQARPINRHTGLLDNEMDVTRLNESQFTRCAVYRVLAEYILPQHTKWNASGDEDKFQIMMKHYAKKYDEEFELVMRDGIEYDWDGDSTYEDHEIKPTHYSTRLFR